MILAKDIKILKGASKNQFNLALGTSVALALLMLFTTYNNLDLSIYYAYEMGLDFDGIMAMWSTEPELKKIYSGYEVQSLHRFNMAILNLGCSMLILMFAYSGYSNRLRNKRILEALDKCGAISGDKSA